MFRHAGKYATAAGLLLATPLLVRLYTINPYLGLAPETYSATLTSHALARAHTIYLDEYFPHGQIPDDLAYAFPRRDGHIVSYEPLASPATFAPFFLRYRARAQWAGRLVWIGNHVAAEIAAGIVVLLGVWLLTLVHPTRAVLVAAIVALATSHRTINGAGLWTHTAAALWLVAGLFLWSHARRRPLVYYPAATTALGLATLCRASLLPAAALAVIDAWRATAPRRLPAAASAIAVTLVGTLALGVNWVVHGSLLGGRAEIVSGISTTHAVSSYFQFSPVHLLGLLVSPSRGMLVYTPVVLCALPGLVRSLRGQEAEPMRLIALAGIAIFVLHGFIATWWGGWVFGPRYMTDLLPFIALWLALSPLPRRGRGLAIGTFTATLLWSFGVQQLGTMTYPCSWNRTPVSVDQAHERLWDWHDTQLRRCLARLRPQRG